ncbi:YraN family protein [uncultured Anaerococcus sp.]|uniref:YraN family protein n=1 Tax=uncultured Anaerococcus sp. TaxID=293428 RepID=UPI00261E3A62|nr:YraN family protein [uncultured Anaerococcus sp.]
MSEKRKVGDLGERVIANFLMKKGYQILDRNYSKAYGEIDIVALKDDIVCFVEVKTRKSIKYGYPREAVNYYKQQRIIRASQTYLMENNLTDYIIRYDVGEVFTESRKINYIENAF